MNEGNRRMELLGSAPIPKALLAMGLPAMIGMMINALYNLVDAYFVGGLGTSQMGAISVAFPLGQIVVGLGLLFGNGAASYISRLLGYGEKETANKAASTALYGSLLGNDCLRPAFSGAGFDTSGRDGEHIALCFGLRRNLYGLIHIQCL